MGNALKRRLRGSPPAPNQTKQTRRVVPNHLISEELENPNHKYLNNKVKTTKYTVFSFLPKNIFEQFHRVANLYFLFIVLLNWIPQVNAFGKEVAMIPVIFVLCVTGVKDAYEDYRRYKSDKRINHNKCRVFSRNDKRYIGCEWSDLTVGDIIHLSCNEVIPADVILLRSSDEDGVAHIDTSNLDGENNLKQRNGVRQLQQGDEFKPTMFTHIIECELPNMEIYKFRGAMLTQLQERITLSNDNLLLRGCIIRNTDFVEGIIVYAGHDTKALLNNRGPRYKRSKLERLINRDVLWSVILLLLLCFLCSLGTGLWLSKYPDPDHYPVFLPALPDGSTSVMYIAFLRFWTFMILFQVVIPLSLYVSVELIKISQVYFIENDLHLYHEATDKPVECRALNINEELGQIQYVFSDKTGTLTENKMVFKQCTIAGTNYGQSLSDNSVYDDPNMSRASINSGSTVGLSNMQHDPRLDAAISGMKIRDLSEVTIGSNQDTKIQEFFLLMAVCNTVVVSATEHIDKMDDEGIIHDSSLQVNHADADSAYTSDQPSLERYARLDINNQTDSFSSRLRFPSMRRNNRSKRLENEDSDCDISVSSSANMSLDTTHSLMSERLLHKRYEAESPDELALVHAACAYRCRLTKRTMQHVTVYLPGEGEVKIEVMHILPFDSNRKRMSVILQHPDTGDIVLYSKGADSAIVSCLKQRKIEDTHDTYIYKQTQAHLTSYAKQGLRTLCMAKRIIPLEQYKSWLHSHLEAESVISNNRERLIHDSACQIECDLELLGATGIEDRLQDGVPETIQALQQAAIKVWVLTGDKQETAINIAHSCRLLSFDHDLIVLNARNQDVTRDTIQMQIQRLQDHDGSMSVQPETNLTQPPSVGFPQDPSGSPPRNREIALVIDGKTLGFALKAAEKDFLELAQLCNSVVCCRVTPHQKADVVKLVRDKLKKVTLAIGDGANDVSMIQTADVGIGISGQEGMQAVMASDFALPRFRFLKRTLLVHGHWCYERLARMALYMWYKNTNFIFVLMWYQIFNGFSGQSCIDDFNLIVYNIFYTALPPIVMGIFDKCADDRTLMENPYLYKEGQSSKIYQRRSYFVGIFDAFYQSVVIFFLPYMAYAGSSAGVWEFGITLCVICIFVNNLHFCLETRHWNIIHWVSVISSVLSFYGVNIYMSLACTSCGPPANPYGVFFHTISTPLHWMCVFTTVVLALLPRYVVRAYQGSFNPSLCLQAQILKRQRPRSSEAKLESIASWTSSLSNRVSMRFGYNQSESIMSDQRFPNSTDL